MNGMKHLKEGPPWEDVFNSILNFPWEEEIDEGEIKNAKDILKGAIAMASIAWDIIHRAEKKGYSLEDVRRSLEKAMEYLQGEYFEIIIPEWEKAIKIPLRFRYEEKEEKIQIPHEMWRDLKEKAEYFGKDPEEIIKEAIERSLRAQKEMVE